MNLNDISSEHLSLLDLLTNTCFEIWVRVVLVPHGAILLDWLPCRMPKGRFWGIQGGLSLIVLAIQADGS